MALTNKKFSLLEAGRVLPTPGLSLLSCKANKKQWKKESLKVDVRGIIFCLRCSPVAARQTVNNIRNFGALGSNLKPLKLVPPRRVIPALEFTWL